MAGHKYYRSKLFNGIHNSKFPYILESSNLDKFHLMYFCIENLINLNIQTLSVISKLKVWKKNQHIRGLSNLYKLLNL
jgi:hypothetical protein